MQADSIARLGLQVTQRQEAHPDSHRHDHRVKLRMIGLRLVRHISEFHTSRRYETGSQAWIISMHIEPPVWPRVFSGGGQGKCVAKSPNAEPLALLVQNEIQVVFDLAATRLTDAGSISDALIG